MLRTRLLMLSGMMFGGLLSSTSAAFAWQSPPARELFDFEAIAAETSDDKLVLQDKTPTKPNETTKPPTRPQSPPTVPTRPVPRPVVPPPLPVPPQPQQPQPQFNPFVNPQPNQPYLARLSRAPDMFGDSFGSLSATISNGTAGPKNVIDLPIAGGSRQFKNEHSRALPTDRVFGLYHHFQNAIESTSPDGAFRPTDANVDRFTVGFEKTFFDGNASVEMRMPFSAPVSLSTPGANFQMQSVGDLVVSLKGLVYSDESQAVALGLAINAPTGSDLNVNLPSAGATNFTLYNNATHLIPFVAYQAAPSENFFFNGFLQFDTPTNANTVQVRGPAVDDIENLSVTNQVLMFVDSSFGYWLFRDPEAEFLTGLAGVLELHYTTAINSADVVADKSQLVKFGSSTGHFDVLNLTIGLQADIARSTMIRAGYVTPLRNGNHRFFDSEFTVAVVFRM